MSSSTSNPASEFGPNEWLVEEMYQRFLVDPDNVDKAWHEFFADYRSPDGDDGPTTTEAPAEAAAPVAPEEPPSEKAVAPAPTPTTQPAEPSQRARAADKTAQAATSASDNGSAAARTAAAKSVEKPAGRRELPRGQAGRRRRQRRRPPCAAPRRPW